MDLIKISYEISDEAREEQFIKHKEYIPVNESWRSFGIDVRETTEEEREFICDVCDDNGDGVFVFNSTLLNSVCDNLEEFQNAVRTSM